MDWNTFWQIAPTVVAVFTIVVGYIFTSGRLKERISHMVSNEALLIHCKRTQRECSQGVGTKIDELKSLVIQLHNSQTDKIDKMDEKREDAKNVNAGELRGMAVAIGKIEQYIEIMARTDTAVR